MRGEEEDWNAERGRETDGEGHPAATALRLDRADACWVFLLDQFLLEQS